MICYESFIFCLNLVETNITICCPTVNGHIIFIFWYILDLGAIAMLQPLETNGKLDGHPQKHTFDKIAANTGK